MKDELITFETAKLAKEKGFEHNYCLTGTYNSIGNLLVNKNVHYFKEGVAALSQSLLQRWLREKHDIFLYIVRDSDLMISYIINDEYCYDTGPWNGNFKTYEEALEEGLQTALKLIKT